GVGAASSCAADAEVAGDGRSAWASILTCTGTRLCWAGAGCAGAVAAAAAARDDPPSVPLVRASSNIAWAATDSSAQAIRGPRARRWAMAGSMAANAVSIGPSIGQFAPRGAVDAARAGRRRHRGHVGQDGAVAVLVDDADVAIRVLDPADADDQGPIAPEHAHRVVGHGRAGGQIQVVAPGCAARGTGIAAGDGRADGQRAQLQAHVAE